MPSPEASQTAMNPARLIALYLPAAAAGWVLQSLSFPLPWLIGPLVLAGVFYGTGLVTRVVPKSTRYGGQMIVGLQIGVYFSSEAVLSLVASVPLLISVTVMTLTIAAGVATISARISGRPIAQIFLSTLPFSPVEATVIAEKSGWSPGPIILSQILRIGIAVTTVPIVLYLIDGWPTAPAGPALSAPFDPVAIAILLAIGVAAAGVFLRVGLANPFFMGPFLISALVAALGFRSAGFPFEVVAMAQIVLGTWLGSAFRRAVFVEARQQLWVIVLSTISFLGLVSAGAVALAYLFGHPWRVLVLGAVPGGVTEMALTAKFLGVDVTMVTGLQMVRFLLIMLTVRWILVLLRRLEPKHGPD